MAYLSAKPRQLAPTVGPQASSRWILARSALGGIGDTIVVGCVLYTKNFAIVPNNCYWTPTRENVTNFTIVPFGDIHVFIGETAAGSMAAPEGVGSRPVWTAIEQDMQTEDQTKSRCLETICLVEAARSNLVSSRPTQSAIVQDAVQALLETIGLVESRRSNMIKTKAHPNHPRAGDNG